MNINKTGLTNDEQKVMDNLVSAFLHYNNLPEQHPMERIDFCNLIHQAQSLLAIRVCRREYPEGWPTHE